ncbi:MAG: flagellar hook-associated protein FlgL [Pseudobdellovibrionaceae bacterium]|nr:flagellar hook-associated protein FlgL [Bdellovibrionales bacterium]USN46479.1 MAG: flagellar hook-associated protein FlgL [Pseudobdellovibrionaceae bacterium]
MRVADNMKFDQVRHNISRNRSEMSHLQNQAATQKRVTKPSDDPVAASRVLSVRVEAEAAGQYEKNLNYARSFLEFTDQSLGEVTDHLVRAKELAINQSSDGSANPETRRVVAEEIGQIYNQLVKVSNRQLGERFIFGGYRTTRPPFSNLGQYNGDDGEMLVALDKGSFLAMNIPGNKIFQGQGLSGDGIVHVTTTQAATLDELMAQLGKSEEFKQNEMEEKALHDQKVEQARNKKQEPEPEPDRGNMRIRLRGPASTEGQSGNGANEGGVNPSDSGLDEAGISIFRTVRDLQIALKTNDQKAVQDTLESLDTAINQVILARAQVGSRVSILDTALGTLQKNEVDNKVFVSQLEDVDAFEVISDINKTEGTLKATLQTSGKLLIPSLMDFID